MMGLPAADDAAPRWRGREAGGLFSLVGSAGAMIEFGQLDFSGRHWTGRLP